MNLPANLPASDDITIITAYTEVIASGTDDFQVTTHYHMPIIYVFFVSIIVIVFFNRLILELLIRLRKK